MARHITTDRDRRAVIREEKNTNTFFFLWSQLGVENKNISSYVICTILPIIHILYIDYSELWILKIQKKNFSLSLNKQNSSVSIAGNLPNSWDATWFEDNMLIVSSQHKIPPLLTVPLFNDKTIAFVLF